MRREAFVSNSDMAAYKVDAGGSCSPGWTGPLAMCGERLRSPAPDDRWEVRFGVNLGHEGSGVLERGVSVDVAHGTFRLYETSRYGCRKDGW